MPLIVTRPRPQAAGFVAELQHLGVPARALPLLAVAGIDQEDAIAASPLRTAWQTLPARRLVMFVSANAVACFFAAAPAGTAWPAGVLAGSTGEGTTRALVAQGVPGPLIVQPAAEAGQFDSEALWRVLCQQGAWRGASVLIVRGSGGREWLADTLRHEGAQVDALAVYHRTPPTLDATEAALLDAAVADPSAFVWHFSSSEAARHLAALTPGAAWAAASALATHERIAEAVRALGFGQVRCIAPGAAAAAAAWSEHSRTEGEAQRPRR